MSTQTQDKIRTTPATGKPATQKQRDFIARLLSGRAVTAEQKTQQTAAINRDDLTTTEASAIIEVLLDAPKTQHPTAAAAAPLEPGMYARDGEVFKVQQARDHGGVYAKRLVGTTFLYAAGAVRDLTPEDRMTREQAAEYGRETGVCCNCGRELTDPDSIAAGIGPVCAERY